VLAFAAPPFLGIVINQLNPSYSTARGVPLMFLVGLVLGTLATGIKRYLNLADKVDYLLGEIE